MKRQLGLLTCLALVPTILAGQTLPSSTVPNGNAGAPRPAVVEGRPIETRPPEKKDNTPAFPEQTRAPYHATAPFKVTTLIDNMHAPWILAFLPGGEILVTERLPGTMRLLDAKGTLSDPLPAGMCVSRGLPRGEGHRTARCRRRSWLREQPPNLFHFF